MLESRYCVTIFSLPCVAIPAQVGRFIRKALQILALSLRMTTDRGIPLFRASERALRFRIQRRLVAKMTCEIARSVAQNTLTECRSVELVLLSAQFLGSTCSGNGAASEDSAHMEAPNSDRSNRPIFINDIVSIIQAIRISNLYKSVRLAFPCAQGRRWINADFKNRRCNKTLQRH